MPRPSVLSTATAQASYKPLSTNSDSLTPRTLHSLRPAAAASPAKLVVQEWSAEDEDRGEEAELLPLEGLVVEEGEEKRDKGHRRMSGAIVAIVLGCCMMVYSIVLRQPAIAGIAPLISPVSVGHENPLPISTPTSGIPQNETVDDHADPVDPDEIWDYSKYQQFPLSQQEYAQQCYDLPTFSSTGFLPSVPFWQRLPHPLNKDVLHPTTRPKHQCTRTITYLLSPNIGLSQELAYVSLAAAFARERGASFFVLEDENRGGWARGSWLDHFADVRMTQMLPFEPDCLPPPPSELVACPRTVKHWVLTHSTVHFHLGGGFNMMYEDPKAQNEARTMKVFEMMRRSLDFTIIPAAGNRQFIRFANAQLEKEFATDTSQYVGVHIRQGDRLASVWEYHDTHVPISEFATALLSSSTPKPKGALRIYVALDSPDAAKELEEALIEQGAEEFKLMSLATSEEPLLRRITSDRAYNQTEWSDRPLEERIRLTRGAIVDFSLSTGAWSNGRNPPVSTICTLSSSACKLAVLFQGFQRSFIEGRWIDVDQKGGIDWTPFSF